MGDFEKYCATDMLEELKLLEVPEIKVLNTCLLSSSSQGYHRIVEYLLSKGADPNYPDEQLERTPLFFAAFEDNIETVKVLLKYKADPNKRHWWRCNCVYYSRGRSLKLLIEHNGIVQLPYSQSDDYSIKFEEHIRQLDKYSMTLEQLLGLKYPGPEVVSYVITELMEEDWVERK